MPALDSEALDFRASSECFAPVRKLCRVPTVGGVLLFGRDRLGLIEQWGSGIQRMTAACREVGTGPQAPKRRYYRTE